MVGLKVCRLCLYNGEDLVSVVDDANIVNKIKEYVTINFAEHEHLPSTACTMCLQKIKDWSDFKDTCLRSTQILLETVSQNENATLQQKEFASHESPSEGIKFLANHDDKVKENKLNDEEIQLDLQENVYKCEICLKEYRNCLEYLDHQPIHNGEPVFKCDKCSEVFTCREDLVEHDRNHRRPCPHCGKMILRSSMKLHLIKHTDRHMCSQCNSRFNSRAALLQHTITLHTDQKDHICETCGKRFSSKTSMTVHLKSHSDERLYRCKVCSYAGRTASAVYVHMSTHAKEVHICQVCSKTFKSNRNLNDHLRRVHSTEKKHRCPYCDKTFVDKYMLTVHVRCHTGVRPYVCRLCDKAFIRSDGLKEHMATHGDRVWYKCDRCGRKFASKKSVARHNCSGNKS